MLPVLRSAQHGVRHDPAHALHQPVAQAREPLLLGLPLRGGLTGRHPEAGERGGVEGAGAHRALLPAPVLDGRQPHRAPGHEGPGAHRSAHLVGRDGQRGEPRQVRVDGQRAEGLHGVAVEGDPELLREGGDLRDGLDGAHLVVGPHDGQQRGGARVAGQFLPHGGRVHAAGRVDGQPDGLGALVGGQPLDGVGHRGVLHRGDEDAAAAGVLLAPVPVQALDGQVVGLGAPGGEDHLDGLRAQGRGDVLAGLLDDGARRAAGAVQRGRVAAAGQLLGDRGERGGPEGRGGGVVEVGGLVRHGLQSRAPARACVRRP